MQTPLKNAHLYPFNHSWSSFQKILDNNQPEIIILLDWSNRCLHCCITGHYSKTCPLPGNPKQDLCTRCHAPSHTSSITCPNKGADMKKWACMNYTAPPPAFANRRLQSLRALDAHACYKQRKQAELADSTPQLFSYCGQEDHLKAECPVQQQDLQTNPPLNAWLSVAQH